MTEKSLTRIRSIKMNTNALITLIHNESDLRYIMKAWCASITFFGGIFIYIACQYLLKSSPWSYTIAAKSLKMVLTSTISC